jgi:glycosyltransferase involved in cell wall biosynthesis
MALRVLVLGASPAPLCGVRDHAAILSAALEREGVSCSTSWLTREPESLRASHRRMGAWTRAVRAELDRTRAQAILLHYSVFSFSYRGLPLFTHGLLGALGDGEAPLLSILHEYAYPWRRDGAVGLAWALTQRAALLELVRASAAITATTESRAGWLRTRAWLPRRPVAVTPVFSNLPAPAGGEPPENPLPVIGIFGYSYGAAVARLICAALRSLQDDGRPTRLLLIGAPGPGSPEGEQWVRSAAAAGLASAPSFTGRCELAELAEAIGGCEVILNADPSGPSSRKTTLAAALASGRPVLALDGPARWVRLAESGAALIVEPAERALADALRGLIDDQGRREQLGGRGAAFAAENMTPEKSAATIARLLRGLLNGAESSAAGASGDRGADDGGEFAGPRVV